MIIGSVTHLQFKDKSLVKNRMTDFLPIPDYIFVCCVNTMQSNCKLQVNQAIPLILHYKVLFNSLWSCYCIIAISLLCTFFKLAKIVVNCWGNVIALLDHWLV